jgi:hypothetical protein
LLLGRMARLNVDHLGLFLVERVPLVFQQAAAIRMDTGKTFLIFKNISECLDKIEIAHCTKLSNDANSFSVYPSFV